MSAVLQESWNGHHMLVIELLQSAFEPFYLGDASMVLMHPSTAPSVGDRVVLVEMVREEHAFVDRRSTSIDRPTGRDVSGLVTHITSGLRSSMVHFHVTGRTWDMRDEHKIHGESFIVKPQVSASP